MTDFAAAFAQAARKPTMAELLMRQGVDTSPTPSWGAALARALQGGLGGYYEGQDKAARKKEIDGMPALADDEPTAPPAPVGFTPQPQSLPPSRVASLGTSEPDMGPPPATRQGGMTIGNVMSAEPAPDSYHPQDFSLDAQRPPPDKIRMAMASVLQGQPAPQAAPPVSQPQQAAPLPPLPAQVAQQSPQGQQAVQRATPKIDPVERGQIKRMMLSDDPVIAASGAALYQDRMKPKDQFRPLVDPQERARQGLDVADKAPYRIDMATGKVEPINTSAQTTQTVNSVADPIREGVGKQFDTSLKNARTSSRALIPEIHDARAALDQGTVTGQFADPRLVMQKIGALFGMPSDQASNTEVFRATIGRQVLAHAKELGANPSNTDRDFIKAVEGGKGDLEESTMRRLLDLSEKYARQGINFHNADADKLIAANPDAYKSIAGVMKVDQPAQYQAPARQAPGSGQPASGAGKVRRYNPATGKIE